MPSDQITKRQHHIPQMLLKRFTTDSGSIYMFDAKNNKISLRNTTTVAVKNHLYTVISDQIKDDALEKKFSLLESKAEETLNKILSENINEGSVDDLQDLLEFVVVLMLRTPRLVQLAESVASNGDIEKAFREKNVNASPEEIAQYISDITTQKGRSYSNAIHSLALERHSRLIENFDIILGISETGAPPLLVNDNYDIKEPSPGWQPEEGKNDWYNQEITIVAPLASTACLIFIPKPDKERRGTKRTVFAKRIIEKEHISRMNRLSFLQMDGYLYGASEEEILAHIRKK